MKVIAGFTGEFGWEIATFYPRIVWYSQHGHDVDLYTFKSSVMLYRDLPGVNILDNGIPRRVSGHGNPDGLTHVKLEPNAHVDIPRDVRNTRLLAPGRAIKVLREDCPPVAVGKHVMVHARKFERGKSSRNWIPAYEAALDVFESNGYDIYFFGDPDYSIHVQGRGVDLRGEEESKVFGILKSSYCCFGPSSGALVMAQWCRVPLFTWADCADRTARERNTWTKVWNPFEVASYHPWSGVNTEEAEKRRSVQCKPTAEELVLGVEFMLKDMP